MYLVSMHGAILWCDTFFNIDIRNNTVNKGWTLDKMYWIEDAMLKKKNILDSTKIVVLLA
jgi:hypothetical protein